MAYTYWFKIDTHSVAFRYPEQGDNVLQTEGDLARCPALIQLDVS